MAARRPRKVLESPPSPPLGSDPVLAYELRRAEASSGHPAGSLAVTIHVVRRDGQPCPYVPFVQRPGAHSPYRLREEPDLKVAALLPGGRLAEWIPLAAENYEGRYTLSPAQVERALPWMLRSRRAQVADGPRLVWLGDAPWQLTARLERDTAEARATLRFELVRDAERLDYGAPEPWRIGEYVLLEALGLRLASPTAAQFAEDLLAAERLTVPLEREHELAAALRGAPPGLAVTADAAPLAAPRPVIELTPRSFDRTLGVQLAFDYGGERVRARDLHDIVRSALRSAQLVRRDRAAERAALAASAPLRSGAPRPLVTFEEDDRGVAWPSALEALVAAAEAAGWAVEAEQQRLRTSGRSSFSIRSGVDWFTLDGAVQYDEGAYARFEDLVAAERAGRPWVPLADGSVGLVPEQWLRGFPLLALAAAREGGGDGLHFRRSQVSLLTTWLRHQDGDPRERADEAFARASAQCAALAERTPAEPPASFQGTLRDYQRVGLGWFTKLHAVGAGGVLADDMGLGKTVQVLAHLELRRTAGSGPLLVVAPRSVVHQWCTEAARFTPELPCIEHWGPARAARAEDFAPGTLYVTSYGTLRRDYELLARVALDTIVFDEAHALKNPASQTFQAARSLCATTRLALTGTPVENSLGDLWALSEVLNPGLLGGRETYGRLVAGSALDAGEGARWDLSGPLRRLVAPFLLRRTKAEVLTSLPARTEQTVLLTPSDEEARRYDALRQVAHDEVVARRGKKLGLVALEALLRLRQEACHPGLLDPSQHAAPSTKVDALVERLQELAAEGYKALVFSQFTKLLGIVRARLDAAGITYEYLDGSTRDRATPVQRFQEDPSRTAFLISLKAGGAGLNLTAADFVFLLDPWWNPAAEAQAIDRAHRLGRTRPVFAYRLVVRGTIEEKVLALQAHKRELADAILAADEAHTDPSSALAGALTEADLTALLTR